MTPLTALAYANQILALLPSLIQVGFDVVGFIEDSAKQLQAMQAEGRDPTPEEWAALNAKIDELRARLHTKLHAV